MEIEPIRNESRQDTWRRLIRRGEDALLQRRYQEAERDYLQALSCAKSALPEDPFWEKTFVNLRYLYVNYLCERPLTPDILLERTVPLWEQVLGSDHYFIARWIRYIDDWRQILQAKEKSKAEF